MDSGFNYYLFCMPLLSTIITIQVFILCVARNAPCFLGSYVTLLTLIIIPMLESSFTYYRSGLAYYIFRAEI